MTGRIAPKSSIKVYHGFQGGLPWDEALEGLVASLGGALALKQLLTQVDAEDQHVHFQIPVMSSLLQENNYLDRGAIGLLQDLRLWIGFDFSEFDPSVPTHLDFRV